MSIIAKLDPNMQNLVKIVIWRDDVPLYPEEVEIEDASKINLDWLINIKDLDIIEDNKKSVIMDDPSILSFSEQSFFSVNPASQKVVEFQEDEYQPLAQHGLDTSLEEMNNKNSQNTTNTKAQGSQSIGEYGKPLALT